MKLLDKPDKAGVWLVYKNGNYWGVCIIVVIGCDSVTIKLLDATRHELFYSDGYKFAVIPEKVNPEPAKPVPISKYFGFANDRLNCTLKVFEQDSQILIGGNCWDTRVPAMTIDEFDEFLVMGSKALDEATEMQGVLDE
jgi:hypothetical protein